MGILKSTEHKPLDSLPYNTLCKYLVSAYLRLTFCNYFIPKSITELCILFHGIKLIDTIIITKTNIYCNKLTQLLFPNGIPSNYYSNEFDNNQRKELWKLLLITKYKLSNKFVFKTLSQFTETNSPSNNPHCFRCIQADVPRTTPIDISIQSVQSCLTKFYSFYPNAYYWSAQTCLIVPFLYVFNDGKDGNIETSIETEYMSYLCYSSLVTNIYSMYSQGHNKQMKNSLLKVKSFWDRQNDHGMGNAREMLECQIGIHAGKCLTSECFKCLYPDYYNKLNNLGIDDFQYSYKLSILLLWCNTNTNKQTAEKLIKLYDYLFLFGIGNIIFFKIAFIVLTKNEMLESDKQEDVMIRITKCDVKEWDFDMLCKMVYGMRCRLKKKNPELLELIMTHANNIDVIIEVLTKYYH
eukprot:120610_1